MAQYGNRGRSYTSDPTIPKDESGHPVRHRFTLKIPSSQLCDCHMHPGTNVENSYLWHIWWDNEGDAEQMYPKKQHTRLRKNPSASWVTIRNRLR